MARTKAVTTKTNNLPKAIVARQLDQLPEGVIKNMTNVLQLDERELAHIVLASDKEAKRVYSKLKQLFGKHVGAVQGAKTTLLTIKDGLGLSTDLNSDFDTMQQIAMRIQLFELLVAPHIKSAEIKQKSLYKILKDGLQRLPAIQGQPISIANDNLATVKKPRVRRVRLLSHERTR